MLNKEIKQLQKEMEKQIKTMDITVMKQYIERNIAYYYSHYANTMAFESLADDEQAAHQQDAIAFQDTFFDTIDTMLDSIRNDATLSGAENQMKINYILCVLYSNFNDNLVYNRQQEAQRLEELQDKLSQDMIIQDIIYESILIYAIFVNKAGSLFYQCKTMLITLYVLTAAYNVDDVIFNSVNMTFKSMFLDFYANYLPCKFAAVQLETLSRKYGNIEKRIESSQVKKYYLEAKDILADLEKSFNAMVKSDDFFLYAKQSLNSNVINDGIAYNLKLFDVYNASDKKTKKEAIKNNAMCKEFKALERMENLYNIHVLFK